jgi:RNA polymerase sigma factor (sigma-70 family)
MRNDADFAAYMAARWPFLVRSLVLIGCPQADAQAVARTGLAHCYAAWDRVRTADDVDAFVYRTVLECWHKSRKPHWWSEQSTEVAPPTTPPADASDLVLLRHALEEQLRRLSPEHREVLVLRFVAGLTDTQVAEVLEEPVGTVAGRINRALTQIDLAALKEVTG